MRTQKTARRLLLLAVTAIVLTACQQAKGDAPAATAVVSGASVSVPEGLCQFISTATVEKSPWRLDP